MLSPIYFGDLVGFLWILAFEDEELQIKEGSSVVIKRVPSGLSAPCDLWVTFVIFFLIFFLALLFGVRIDFFFVLSANRNVGNAARKDGVHVEGVATLPSKVMHLGLLWLILMEMWWVFNAFDCLVKYAFPGFDMDFNELLMNKWVRLWICIEMMHAFIHVLRGMEWSSSLIVQYEFIF